MHKKEGKIPTCKLHYYIHLPVRYVEKDIIYVNKGPCTQKVRSNTGILHYIKVSNFYHIIEAK